MAKDAGGVKTVSVLLFGPKKRLAIKAG